MKQVPRTYTALELYHAECGRRMREQRLALRLTQKQVGSLADLHQAVISRAERGKGGLSDEAKFRVAAALGMDFNDLFGRTRAVA